MAAAQPLARARMAQNTFDHEQEVLYLPNGQGLRLLSFGYTNFLADILWFKAISYFGKHYRSDGRYQWLAHICDLVTELDPHVFQTYSFCSIMLSWEAGRADQSVKLLTRGSQVFPDRWEIFYLLGFTKMYFLQDPAGAHKDFAEAARIPAAPIFLASLASKNLINLDRPQDAIDFLSTLIEHTQDPTERAVLMQRLSQAQKKLNQGSIP